MQNSKPESYTILRIKRKRNEEPLDVLVVESRVRRKKSRGGVGVFQYAQTVEKDVWQDTKQQLDLREQISRLAHEEPLPVDLPSPIPPSPQRRNSKDESARRYKIVEQQLPESAPEALPPTKLPLIAESVPPPEVAGLKMYSAVLSTDEQEVDPEVEKFLPLLTEYLKINDTEPTEPWSSTYPGDPDDSDYVWDVFYHRPTTLSEWNQIANIGTLTGLPTMFTDSDDSESESEEGDSEDEDSNAEEYYKNDYPDEDTSDDDDESADLQEHSDDDDERRYEDDDLLW